MQNIVTLGEINDALKIAAVTAAQLEDMGFAALANKPICEGLPPEESRRLRNAKLYPAESIGQIRVALAQRLAAPASVQAISPTFAVHAGDSKVTLHFSSEAEALEFYRTAKFDAGIPGNKTPQAAPAAVAVPDERAAFEAWAKSEDMSIGSDCDGYIHSNTAAASLAWQARAALAATPEQPVVLPEPEAYLFQHEDTGQTMFVEAQQVEWGFEANNPRLQKISGVYTEQQLRALLAQAAIAAAPAHPAEGVQAVEQGEVLVTVSGFTGCGKSAIAGEIEIMCRALGLQVEWPDGDPEKNLTHADWTEALELYKPRVRIVECNVPHPFVKGQDK